MAEQPPGTVDRTTSNQPGSAQTGSEDTASDQAGSDQAGSGTAGTNGNGSGPAQPVWQTGWQRLSRTFVNPSGSASASAGRTRPAPKAAAATPDFATMTDAQKRQMINQIDGTERKIGYAAAALAAVLTVAYNVPFMVSRITVETTVKPTGHTCADGYRYTTHGAGQAATCNTIFPVSHYAWYLVVLLVFSAGIFITVRIGRRAPLAFAMVLTGLALGSLLGNTIAVLPFIVAGGWLLLRAWRSQKNGSPTAKAPLPGYTPPARGPAPRGKAGSTSNASRRARKG